MGDFSLKVQAYNRWADSYRSPNDYEEYLQLKELKDLVRHYLDIDTPKQLFERLEEWNDKHYPEFETAAEVSDVDSWEE